VREWGGQAMNLARVLRIGSICAFLYIAIFVASQVYLSSAANKPPDSLKNEQADHYAARVLQFAHDHPEYYSSGMVFAVLGSLLLLGPFVAVSLYIGRSRSQAGRLALALGVVGLVVSAISTVIYTRWLVDYAHTHVQGAGTLQALGHAFRKLPGEGTSVELAGGLLTVIWFVVVGMGFLRLRGNGDPIGWANIAAGLLTIIPILPILPLWSLGAGLGLWRAASTVGTPSTAAVALTGGLAFDPADEADDAGLPEERPARPLPGVTPAARPRQQPVVRRGGSGAKRRKRR